MHLGANCLRKVIWPRVIGVVVLAWAGLSVDAHTTSDRQLILRFNALSPYCCFNEGGEQIKFSLESAKQRETLSEEHAHALKFVVLKQDLIETEIALKPRLGILRERFIGAFVGNVLNGSDTDLRHTYPEAPVFWPRSRVPWLLFGLVLLTLIATAATIAFAMQSRARASATVQAAKDELETIFNATTSGIIAFDNTGKVIHANDRARHLLGGLSMPVPFNWPPEVIFLELENMEPLEPAHDPIRRALAGAELRNSTHLMTRTTEGSSPRYVRLNSTTLSNDQTDISSVIVLDDVTSEEQTRHIIELVARLEALGQRTGGIAHDFNNILTTMLSSIFLARRAKDAAEVTSHLHDAEASVLQARSLTSRLMASAQRSPELAESVNIGQMMEDCFALVSPMLEETITLKIELEDRNLLVLCEHAQLKSILLNLVLNSRDTILREGVGNEITLSAKTISELDEQEGSAKGPLRASRYVEMSVTHNGPDMDAKTIALATDPFFTAKDKNPGTGLGLSMARAFARQADGDLRISSEIGAATTVQLILPCGTQVERAEDQAEADNFVMGNGQTILVAQNDLESLKAISNLVGTFNYKVISAKGGAKALELVQRGEVFDLLLTDVVMPGELGRFRLAEAVRALRPNVPVVYFSGYAGFSTSEMGKVTGPLLQKPAVPAEMSRVLASALLQEN